MLPFATSGGSGRKIWSHSGPSTVMASSSSDSSKKPWCVRAFVVASAGPVNVD